MYMQKRKSNPSTSGAASAEPYRDAYAPVPLPEAFLRTHHDLLQLTHEVREHKTDFLKLTDVFKKHEKDLSSVKKTQKQMKEDAEDKQSADLEVLTKVCTPLLEISRTTNVSCLHQKVEEVNALVASKDKQWADMAEYYRQEVSHLHSRTGNMCHRDDVF